VSNEVTERPPRNARAHILETAWRLVGERGVQAVTVADIAAASGVSRQLVYHHFESRAGLLVAMARHHDGVTGFRTRIVATRELAPVEGLHQAMRLWLDYVPEILDVARALEAALIAGDEGGAAWRDRMDDLHEAFRLAVERIDEAGRLADGWTVDAAADWVYARTQVSMWQYLVVDRDWRAADYIQRTIASVMSEIVSPSEGE
jgi:AcrR family transcriptional regulator